MNEITDDIIHLTQYYMKYILNRAILANLQCRPLKLSRYLSIESKYILASLQLGRLLCFENTAPSFSTMCDIGTKILCMKMSICLMFSRSE